MCIPLKGLLLMFFKFMGFMFMGFEKKDTKIGKNRRLESDEESK